jgi:hypothetical protein
MGGLNALLGLAIVGTMFVAAAVFWFILTIVLLPFRILAWVIALPLLLVKAIVFSIAGVLAGLLFALGVLVAALGFVVVVVPLLPIVVVVLLTVLIVRLMKRPATT